MEKHFELDDQEFELQFERCTMDPAIFSHEAHLRLAWIHITQYGIETALQKVPAQLQRFVAHVGAKDKYNATLTMAAIKAVSHFVRKSNPIAIGSDNFSDFIAEFPRLKYNFKELMGSHYAIDIFNSNAAKARFLEPDLLPFD